MRLSHYSDFVNLTIRKHSVFSSTVIPGLPRLDEAFGEVPMKKKIYKEALKLASTARVTKMTVFFDNRLLETFPLGRSGLIQIIYEEEYRSASIMECI